MLTLPKLRHRRETCPGVLFHPISLHPSNLNIRVVNYLDMRNHSLPLEELQSFLHCHLEVGTWNSLKEDTQINPEWWWVLSNHIHSKFCVFPFMATHRLTIRNLSPWTGKELITSDPSLTATSSWPGPIIIGGDFNHELHSLPIWKSLEDHGWKESRTFFPCDPSSLPPTYCKRDAQGSILAS